MAYLVNPQNTIAILKKYDFSFQKKYGQNFLIDTHVLDKIIAAAGITQEDCVVEIGPGIGTLTQYLAESAREVIAVEIDRMLIPILEETLADYPNVTVINQDILKVNMGKLVSYIPQIVHLNGETVRNNVAFFEEESQIDDARVKECLQCAQIWEEVQAMPDGVHTLIGENGTAISGGQRQRVALARALYKEFELLVMDEAMAALDMETEKAVIDSIRQVKKGKTLLIVTHHMSLANECDMIYKIENKKIVRVK